MSATAAIAGPLVKNARIGKERFVLLLAVVVIALATLFLLTALALGVGGHLRHPLRVTLALGAALVVGVALLYEYGSAR